MDTKKLLKKRDKKLRKKQELEQLKAVAGLNEDSSASDEDVEDQKPQQQIESEQSQVASDSEERKSAKEDELEIEEDDGNNKP